MKNINSNRRKYPRYNTELDVYFQVRYTVRLRVEFHILDGNREGDASTKYFGLCNNISAEGLLIVAKKQLLKDDILILEVYAPQSKNPIKMEGQVRWCAIAPGPNQEHDMFYIGVQIISVDGKSVNDSIFFDKKHLVAWSAVLESLLGDPSAIKK